MKIEINDLQSENYFIPPMSLQMLIENAIKHNEFNKSKQLDIFVTISNDSVSVRNNLNPKKDAEHSTKTGLANLQNRFYYMTNRDIEIVNLNNFFEVRLPLLRSSVRVG
jgi:LytS/YehU family sensor histidine kinase